MPLTGRQKATILLSLLGPELSGLILKFLPEDLQDAITSGMNSLPAPSPELISSVIKELSGFMALPSAVQETPVTTKQNNISEPARVVNVKPTQSETPRSPYDILFYSQPKKVAAALSAERVPVIVFVLSILPEVQRKEVLNYFGDKKIEFERMIKTIKNTLVKEKIKENVVKILSARLERLSLS